MSCCGKNNQKKNVQPTGTSTKSTDSKVTEQSSTTTSKSSSKTQTFILQKPDGSTTTYGSRLEAMADRARYGGTVRF